MRAFFNRISATVARITASPYASILAALLVIVWAATGPFFHYSDTWQLIINTSTTVITFLMVFTIQNSQQRDGIAIQLKLDELLRSIQKARNSMLSIEDLSDEELEALRKQFHELGVKGDQGTTVTAVKVTDKSSSRKATKHSSSHQP